MIVSDIARIRLSNHNLAGRRSMSAGELAGWMGAIQAQDYNMVRWAFAIRMPGSAYETVNKAIDDGEIIRTHLLRPTWHFVSSSDLTWMLDLTAPRIKPSLKYRQIFLGLDQSTLERTNAIIASALRGRNLTREEIVMILKENGIDVDNNRASHILLWAELSGIICSGRQSGRKPAYALISERVPAGKSLSMEESLGLLAVKYFSSHGPATLKDFAWWSGLSASLVKKAVEIAGDRLSHFNVKGLSYMTGQAPDAAGKGRTALLLPAFDEFLIGYSDRSAVMTKVHHKKAISNNGVFRPVVVINGQVNGLWKPVLKKETVTIEASLFGSAAGNIRSAIEDAAEEYGNFTGKKTEVKFQSYNI